jgi:hypothetical protein
MRYPLFSLLLFVASASPAAQAWRWVDQNGVVHYSDQPHPGAEPVQVKPAPKPGSVAPRYVPSSSDSETMRPTERVAAVTQCGITAPQPDQTFDSPEVVSMLLQVLPTLPPGLSVQATLNGQPLPWPQRLFAYQWAEPDRGTHVLRVRIVDARQQTVCEATPVTFNVLRPSLLAPGRQPPKR